MNQLLRDLAARGIRLRLRGDELEFVAPKGAMTPELLRELRERKADLRDYLLLERRITEAAPSDLSLDPDRLLDEVMAAEGTSDLGPEAGSLREALAVYAESVERDAKPHGLGRIYLVERIFRLSLQARLRLARAPSAGPRPKRPPLIVCGLPRSGTTVLHRLLALADDVAGLPLWQLLEPLPPASGADLRREHATRNLVWLNGLVSVSLDAQHYVRPDLPDECGHLLRTSFFGAMPWQAPALSWLAWSLRADARPAYRVWGAYLAHLEPEGARLVLKDPFHAAHLEEIELVCPDALIVQIHRDPVEVAPSFHKLCHTMHAVLSPEIDRLRTAAAETAWLQHVVERNVQARRSFPKAQLCDVDYRDLLRDPIAVVTRVHAAFGLPLTETHMARMRTYVADNPQRAHGDNPYAASEFGETPEGLAERFAEYRRSFVP